MNVRFIVYLPIRDPPVGFIVCLFSRKSYQYACRASKFNSISISRTVACTPFVPLDLVVSKFSRTSASTLVMRVVLVVRPLSHTFTSTSVVPVGLGVCTFSHISNSMELFNPESKTFM